MSEASDAHLQAKTDATDLPPAPLRLPSDLQSIFQQSYPRFSDAEYARRHAGIARAMEAAGADRVLIVTVQNVGNATRWMTGWPGTAEALLLFQPGERMVMFVEYYNHLPLAREMSRDTDVRWGEENGLAKTIEELGRRGARRIGVIGPLGGARWKARSEEHTSELQSQSNLVCRLLLEKKKKKKIRRIPDKKKKKIKKNKKM